MLIKWACVGPSMHIWKWIGNPVAVLDEVKSLITPQLLVNLNTIVNSF